MWCGTKYVLGHSYAHSQLYQLLVETNENVQEWEVFTDCVETLEEVLEDGNDPKSLLFLSMLCKGQETLAQ